VTIDRTTSDEQNRSQNVHSRSRPVKTVSSDRLNKDESQALIKLCRAGKLYEIEDWIASGRSLQTALEIKQSVLSEALTTGFHSLVELIARHETNQKTRNRGLAQAVGQRRWEYVELLVGHGADLKSVPFIEVLECWNPNIIRFFLNNGADAISDNPFAHAFKDRIRTALRPFVEYKQRHPEIADKLQEQIDQALRYFADKGDLKWVSLLAWAGADPRSRGWSLDYDDGPEGYSTALEEDARGDSLKVLKRLKPDPAKDDLSTLLNCASPLSRTEIMGYLLDLGANPNDKANGGSTSLGRCLLYLSFSWNWDRWLHGSRQLVSRYAAGTTIDCIKLLAKHGAIWKPDDSSEVNDVRRTLCKAEPDVTLEILKIFLSHKSCTHETIEEVLKTPRMKEHLASQEREFRRIGFDLRSREKKAQDARDEEESKRHWILYLARKYERDKLYEQVWDEPLQKLAKKYNLSDVGLAKICKEAEDSASRPRILGEEGRGKSC
jgi:hypothetical protein